MTFLPVAQRELLVAAQRRVTFRIRTGTALLAATMVFLLLVTGRLGDPRAGGHQLFFVLSSIAAVLAAMAGLFLTADSISEERRSGTLGLLFLTDLRAIDILAGKLAASGLNAGGALLSVVPVLAFSWTLGGVTWPELVLTASALLNLLWSSLSVGLWVSSRRSGAGNALMETAAWLTLWMLVIPSFPLPAAPDLLRILSPVTAWTQAAGLTQSGAPHLFSASLLTSHFLGWGLLVLASLGLKSRVSNPAARRTHSLILWTRGGVPDDANPVMWVMQPGKAVRRSCWALAFLGAGAGLLGLVAAIYWGYQPSDPFQRLRWSPIEVPEGAVREIVLPLILALLVLKLLFAWHCCRAAGELREGGLELLLSTPLRAMEVPRGIWHAGERGFLRPAAFLGFTQLVITLLTALASPDARGWVGFFAAGYSLLVTVLDFATLAWWATYFGLRDGRPVIAFGKTIAAVLAWRVLVFFIPDLLLAMFMLEWGRLRFLAQLREARADDASPRRSGLWSLARG